MIKPTYQRVELDSASIEIASWSADGELVQPPIVLLHDGLGSVAQWRDVPALVAERTGRLVIAYDRPGHGGSTPVPSGAWPADWLHQQAIVLGELLAALGISAPCLVGHSDGGSVAALYAASNPTEVSRLVLLAAHSWVEDVCRVAIEAMRSRRELVLAGLARSHEQSDALFEAWSSVWVSEEFRRWDIRPLLESIECPTLVAQGSADEFATQAQLGDTAAAIGPNAESRLLAGMRHLMHHQSPEEVVDLIAGFMSA